MKCSLLLEDSLLEQIKNNKKAIAAVVLLAILFTLAIALLTVPQALGDNQNSQPKDVVGVGQKQAHLEDELESYDVESNENLDQIVELAQKDTFEVSDPEVSQDALKEKDAQLDAQNAEKIAAQKARQEAQAQAQAKAKEEADKKLAEEAQAKAKEDAQKKELEAEKAVAKAVQEAKNKSQAQASNGGDWKPVTASMYYDVGSKTATGEILQSGDMIIAHKTLPFGTKVEIEYNGAVVQATVGDRGPYVQGRQIDLAPAVQDALGIHDGVVTMNMRIVG